MEQDFWQVDESEDINLVTHFYSERYIMAKHFPLKSLIFIFQKYIR